MNRIHFDQKVDWPLLTILLIPIGFYFVASYGLFGLDKSWSRFFLTIAGVLNVVGLSKTFWYKYYVRWNSKVITIKFNSFSGRFIRFADIKYFKLSESELVISKHSSGKKIVIPTSGIAEEDLQTLENILRTHTETIKV